MVQFNADNANTDSFKITEKITYKKCNNGKKYVEIMVPSKYLSVFWRTFKMPLINCEINIDLNWYKNCVILGNNENQDTKFSRTDTKL